MEEHNRVLIDKWNEKIKPNDIVYHLGDFCFSSLDTQIKMRNKLNGDITIIKGNHDPSVTRLQKIFKTVVKEDLIVELEEHRLILSHKPTEKTIKYPLKYYWNIHGHEHIKTGLKVRGHRINVNLIFCDYYPVSEEEIMKLIIETEENE